MSLSPKLPLVVLLLAYFLVQLDQGSSQGLLNLGGVAETLLGGILNGGPQHNHRPGQRPHGRPIEVVFPEGLPVNTEMSVNPSHAQLHNQQYDVCRAPRGVRGKCIFARNCMYREYANNQELFHRHACSIQRQYVGICCPENAIRVPQTGGFNPGNNGFNPGNTGFNQGNTGYNPGNIGYNPGNTGFNPGNNGFDQGNTGFNPGNTGFNQGNNGFNPGNNLPGIGYGVNPGFSPSNFNGNGVDQGYRGYGNYPANGGGFVGVTSGGYNPNRPFGHNPNRPLGNGGHPGYNSGTYNGGGGQFGGSVNPDAPPTYVEPGQGNYPNVYPPGRPNGFERPHGNRPGGNNGRPGVNGRPHGHGHHGGKPKPVFRPWTDHEKQTSAALYEECGTNFMTRIVGGVQSEQLQWPWMGALLLQNDRRRPFCGGALINGKCLLTAAHCTAQFKAKDLIVRLGEYDFDRTDDDQHQDYGVAEIKQHAEYNKTSHMNDISIIILDKSAVMGDDVSPICLANPNTWVAGKMATVAGWGTTSHGGQSSPVLRHVTVPVWKNPDCYAALKKNITRNFLCAANPAGGQDSCQGDSGGPLMFPDEHGRYHAIGVVSWGYRCADVNSPGVYTRVSRYLPWIIERCK